MTDPILNILVVDDEPAIRRFLRTSLGALRAFCHRGRQRKVALPLETGAIGFERLTCQLNPSARNGTKM